MLPTNAELKADSVQNPLPSSAPGFPSPFPAIFQIIEKCSQDSTWALNHHGGGCCKSEDRCWSVGESCEAMVNAQGSHGDIMYQQVMWWWHREGTFGKVFGF